MCGYRENCYLEANECFSVGLAMVVVTEYVPFVIFVQYSSTHCSPQFPQWQDGNIATIGLLHWGKPQLDW